MRRPVQFFKVIYINCISPQKYFFHDFNTAGKIPNCHQQSRSKDDDDDDEDELESFILKDPSRSLGASDWFYQYFLTYFPADMVSTFGIFLIALIGFALAFLVFLCELLVDAKARRLQRKWRTRRALVRKHLRRKIKFLCISLRSWPIPPIWWQLPEKCDFDQQRSPRWTRSSQMKFPWLTQSCSWSQLICWR